MLMLVLLWFFVFFRHNAAYEMRISDWSSDVCSSYLLDACVVHGQGLDRGAAVHLHGVVIRSDRVAVQLDILDPQILAGLRIGQGKRIEQIGRASCRERVCTHV